MRWHYAAASRLALPIIQYLHLEKSSPVRQFRFHGNQRVYVNNKYVKPTPGIYRVTVLYQVKKESDPSVWNWSTVRSNTFKLE